MHMVFSRPEKLSHADTLRYEINMLRFAAGRLAEQRLEERDAWIYLEAFLLHYRNLIEFLGNDKPRDTDLHVLTFWELTGLAAPEDLDRIHAEGKALWARYEPRDDQGGGRISQYLQHCTTRRVEAKEWPVSRMISEIEPLLQATARNLAACTETLASLPPFLNMSTLTASTTVTTRTAGADLLVPSRAGKSRDELE